MALNVDSKNQTNPDWVLNAKDGDLGTGVFAFYNPVLDQVAKEMVEGITYAVCLYRGDLILAFQWIPNDFRAFSTLKKTCVGHLCVHTCVEPGCLCVAGKCV